MSRDVMIYNCAYGHMMFGAEYLGIR